MRDADVPPRRARRAAGARATGRGPGTRCARSRARSARDPSAPLRPRAPRNRPGAGSSMTRLPHLEAHHASHTWRLTTSPTPGGSSSRPADLDHVAVGITQPELRATEMEIAHAALVERLSHRLEVLHLEREVWPGRVDV